jgi:hypothetical protein
MLPIGASAIVMDTMTYTYDSEGDRFTTTDALGHTTTYTLGHTTTYTYVRLTRLIGTTDALGNRTAISSVLSPSQLLR